MGKDNLIQKSRQVLRKSYHWVKENFNHLFATERLELFIAEKKPKNFMFAFLSSFAFAVVINLSALIYQVGNGDTYAYMIDQSGGDYFLIMLGRWFGVTVNRWHNNVVVPVFMMLLAMVFLALAIALVVDIFNIHSKPLICLCSFLFIAQPCCYLTVSVYYISDSFALAIFFSVLAAWILVKFKSLARIFIAPIFIMLSLALYQAHFVMVVILCLFYVFFALLDERQNARDTLKKGIAYIISGGLGIVYYMVSVKIVLAVKHVGLTNYRGIDTMGKLDLPKSFAIMQEYIAKMYLQNNKGFIWPNAWQQDFNFRAINIFFFVAFVLLFVFIVVKYKLYKDTLRMVCLALCAFAAPFAWSVIVYMAPDVFLNGLISSQQAFLYIFLLVALSHFIPYKNIIAWGIKGISIVLCCVVLYNFVFAANISAYGPTLAYNRAHFTASQVLAKMEAMPNYKSGQKFALYGDPSNAIEYQYNYDKVPAVNTQIYWSGYGGQGSWMKFVLEKFGRQLECCTFEEYNAVVESAEFKEMPTYPHEGYIREINGIMAIKLEEYTKQ